MRSIQKKLITIIDGMARVTKPGLRKCGECGKPTDSYLLWADGRGTWPGCTDCRQLIESEIKTKSGKLACIVGWRKYP